MNVVLGCAAIHAWKISCVIFNANDCNDVEERGVVHDGSNGASYQAFKLCTGVVDGIMWRYVQWLSSSEKAMADEGDI